MRIAQIVPLWKEIPPKKYGGVEIVASLITEELVRQGHDVTLFACAGSKTKGKLVEVTPKNIYDILGGFFWDSVAAYEFLTYYEVAKRIKQKKFDIIHNHIGFHFLAFAPLIDIPVVTTLHSSLEPDFPYLAEKFKNENYVSISMAQRKLAPYLNYVATVYHGIETKSVKPNLGKTKEYYMFLGSATKDKGIDRVTKAAKDLKIPTVIVGEYRASEEEFLKKHFYPYLKLKNVEFHGEVTTKQKNNFLRNAKALLFTSRWHEAFGLVIPEAMACGTPVVGFSSGAAPELIKDGKTGFLVNNMNEFKKAIKKVDQISRKDCREDTEKRFDVSVMAKNYVSLYKKLIKEKNAKKT